MCEMLNLFVPLARPALPGPVRGLTFEPNGEIQRDFAARYSGRGGAFFAGYCKYCLCGFEDWDALYQIARETLARNALTSVAILHFWSKRRYELEERRINLDEPEACTALPMGTVAILQAEPAERRRHLRVVRSLARAVGSSVVLRLKSGVMMRGRLTSFEETSEVGAIDGHPVVAAEVLEVRG